MTPITLTPLNVSDIELIYQWKNNAALSALMAAQPLPHSKEQTVQWLQSTQSDKGQLIFAIRLKNEQEESLIGIMRFMNIDWVSRTAEYGMYIGPEELRGKSLGRASMEQGLLHAFQRLNLRRIWLRVIASNDSALRLYKSTGFLEEGRLVEHFFSDGQYHDMIVMALLHRNFKPSVTA